MEIPYSVCLPDDETSGEAKEVSCLAKSGLPSCVTYRTLFFVSDLESFEKPSMANQRNRVFSRLGLIGGNSAVQADDPHFTKLSPGLPAHRTRGSGSTPELKVPKRGFTQFRLRASILLVYLPRGSLPCYIYHKWLFLPAQSAQVGISITGAPPTAIGI